MIVYGVNLLHLQLPCSSWGDTQAGYANVPSIYAACLAACIALPSLDGSWREPFAGSEQHFRITPTQATCNLKRACVLLQRCVEDRSHY